MSGQVNVLAELERCGIDYQWATDDEVRCRCPFHDDDSPSAYINLEKRVFKCQAAGCEASGDIFKFLARVLGTNRATVFADLATRYDLKSVKVINVDTVEQYHNAIWQAAPLLRALEERCVNEDLIRKYRLGATQGRISIPITNESGLYVNIRKYLPGAPGAQKFKNVRGHGQNRIFPYDQLQYDEILLCGGEIKAIVAADELNKNGIGAITATTGESNWDPALTPLLRGKKVYVCLDVDEAGQTAAEQRCVALNHVTTWIGNIKLPLDLDEFPHGDINDYKAQGHRLLPLLRKCKKWKPQAPEKLKNEKPREVSLSAAVNAKSAGARVAVKAVISAVGQAPYIIPKTVSIECDRSQKCCTLCPVALRDQTTFDINPEDPSILDMVDASKRGQRDALMEATGIPSACKVVTFSATQHFNVEDTRVSPQLAITNRATDRVMQPAVIVTDSVELNESYDLVGRMHPHPATQQATLLISGASPTQDALSSYVPKNLEQLERFRPHDWTCEGVSSALNSIYRDLEANVTRIFKRRLLHLTVDLAYHSPLFLKFDDRNVKGWVENLIVGDSAQGKSETTMNLMNHYGLGEKVECKNATVAGLLGGLQQMGTRWFVAWGVIPTHDKRLCVLEELKGTSTEVIGKLTDMRSAGIAEIPKIEKRKTHARTRLIALSNPRGALTLSGYNYGVNAISELIGAPEDVRRFDMHLLVGANDIEAAEINDLQMNRPQIDHIYTSDLCRQLILWCWTREHALFTSEAEKLCLEMATKLSQRYTDKIPIVDRGSMRYKLARLAAAVAGRTFSCSDGDLLVRPCHVEFIYNTLIKVYDSDTFGYRDYTEAVRSTTDLKDPETIKKQINACPFPKDVIENLLHTDRIELQDVQDWNAWERTDAQTFMSLLVRKNALKRQSRHYRKTPPFIELLKRLLAEGGFVERPDFIEEEF